MANQHEFIGDSIRTIAAGLAAFIAFGGAVFGAAFGLAHLLSGPISGGSGWQNEVFMGGVIYGFLLAIAVGSGMAGYAIGKTARRAPYVHSALLAALLVAVHGAYLNWGAGTEVLEFLYEDFLVYGISPSLSFVYALLAEAVLVCLPFAILGTWIGLRKRRERESGEMKSV